MHPYELGRLHARAMSLVNDAMEVLSLFCWTY